MTFGFLSDIPVSVDQINTQSVTSKKYKILIVDDDPDTRNIYSEYLTDEGLEIELAFDGEEGLKKILHGGYNLVLLDIMMPKIDGLGILREIHSLPENSQSKQTPIVVLSALDQQRIIDEAKSLGATGFLSKSGLTPDQALQKIKGFLVN